MRGSTEDMGKTINEAGIAASGSGGAALDFDAKQSIKRDYEPAIGKVQARIAAAIDAPVVTLVPNFEANFAKISAHAASDKKSTMFPREWQRQMGKETVRYFDLFAEKLEDLGFTKDDMLQEGFKDAVEKNEIALRVVDKLVKGTYNECVFEGGVCYMQTTPEYWTTNMRDTASDILNLL